MKDDYRCTNEECKHITEYDKPYGEDFPQSIECEECGTKAIRHIGAREFNVPLGNNGNATNGYTSTGSSTR